MKLLKYITTATLAIGIFTTAAFAQSDKTKKTEFDAELAKKLGADDNGMKKYVFCILKTGPKDAEIVDKKKRGELFAGHMANINRLANEGKLAVAGPFGKNDRSYRGLYIFNVATLEEAQKLVETDPVVQAGMMVPELTLWNGTAALLATPEIHKKIARSNP